MDRQVVASEHTVDCEDEGYFVPLFCVLPVESNAYLEWLSPAYNESLLFQPALEPAGVVIGPVCGDTQIELSHGQSPVQQRLTGH